jgi:hypothetical protein
MAGGMLEGALTVGYGKTMIDFEQLDGFYWIILSVGVERFQFRCCSSFSPRGRQINAPALFAYFTSM